MKIIFSHNQNNFKNLLKLNSIFWSSGSSNSSTIVRITSNLIIQQKRFLAAKKNYDKKIKLDPIDIHYRYDDSQFLSGPSWANEPFIKPTEDEMIELTKLKLEKDIQTHIEVDPKQEPFKQVFEGQEDYGRFTNCEVIKDEDGSLWKWVERLMPKQTLGEMRKESQLIPPINKPSSELSYFVPRTRSRLYPIYKDYAVVGRNKRTYWQNRWDHLFNKYNKHILDKLDDIKWENNEKTIVITKVLQIQGDIWKFEKDSREFLQNYYQQQQPIMTGVNEVHGSVEFKGDFIEGIQKFFQEKGF